MSSFSFFRHGRLLWLAVIPPLVFFGIAILHYVGLTTTSDNSLRDSHDRGKDHLVLNVLAAAEIGGFAVLLAGFLVRLHG